MAAISPDSHANSNLVSSLCDCIGNDTVNTHQRHQERHGGKGSQEKEVESAWGDRVRK
jgi:hypothetical protein